MGKESSRSATARITLRLSDELFEAVEALAKRDRRTVASWIRILVEDAVAAAEPPSRKRG